MGATPREILRLSLAESLVLAVGGGCVGIVVAAVGLRLIAHTSPYDLPAALAPELNLPVLGFCVGATLVAALLSGVIPALQASRTDVNSELKEGAKGTASGRTHRMRSVLVAGEIAISVMLLIGASLLIHSFAKLVSVDPGFQPEGAMTARVSLPEMRYGTTQQIDAFWKELLLKLSAVPGVKAVGLLNNFPTSGSKNSSLLRIEGRRLRSVQDGLAVSEFAVSPETFRALGTPLLAVRTIRDTDTATAPLVAVISKRFADVAFSNENPIGKRYDGGHIPGWVTIVGVVGNVTFNGLNQAPELDAYYSYQQFAPDASGIVVRGQPAVADLRQVLRGLDPNVPLTNVRPLGDYVAQSLAARKFLLGLLTGFSGLAILLAAIGLYAVLAFSVQQRRQEIGIRMALGAIGLDVVWLVLRECLVIAVVGTAVGLVGASWGTSFLKSTLFAVTTSDFAAYSAAVGLVLLLAVGVAMGPAMRAARIDPLHALRYE